jgi:4-hydroxy-3-polyprenylbenzoate decarboxylase
VTDPRSAGRGPADPAAATPAAATPAAATTAASATAATTTAAVRQPWVVGVSGASGTPYAAAVLRGLLAAGLPVDLVVSRAARLTILDETGIGWRDSAWAACLGRWLSAAGPGGGPAGRVDYAAEDLDGPVRHWAPGDLAAGPSSGSYPARGMIVVPASTASVAGIALGLSKDLLQRAADVTLKERRPLVVVPREMPLPRSALVHMLALHDAGATVAVASPGFYAGATDARALVDFVAGKVLDAAGVPHTLSRRWTGEIGAARRPGGG